MNKKQASFLVSLIILGILVSSYVWSFLPDMTFVIALIGVLFCVGLAALFLGGIIVIPAIYKKLGR